ncbi:MAG TPA: GNAT family N-acetyltransferase [Burkholderiaceae bacterium]|nr:GNAT family N-acetyltransferase [Burkholderiaceae bacterium]
MRQALQMFEPASIPPTLRAHGHQYTLAARIEDAALSVSQPTQQSFFDGWLLRYSPGKAKRARSINSVGGGVLPLDEKISHCIDFYRQLSLPCLFRITPFSQPYNLDSKLADAGFGAHQDTRVMSVALSQTKAGATPTTARSVDAEQFAAVFCKLHGIDATKASAERDRYARASDRSAFVVQWDNDAPIACGSVAIERGLAGIFGMVTATEHRGRGVASSIVSQLLQYAREAGAEVAYLQVEADNAPARRAYSKFGFEDCYAYWYRTPLKSHDNV